MPVLALATLLATLSAGAGPPATVEAARDAVQPGNARAAMLGTWRVLGPASQAHVTQMIRLTMRAVPPTAADFAAARLDADQAGQVLAGRQRLVDEPDSEAVQGLTRDWQQLDSARAEITGDRIQLHFADTKEAYAYTVLSEDGVRVEARMEGKAGAQDVLFTVVDPHTLMFGPLGAEPTVLYRVSAP